MVCDTTTEIPCTQPPVLHCRLLADPGETSPLTGSVLMTTRVGLIYMCLQRLIGLLVCTNQRLALVNRAQEAIFLIASICLTPALLHPRAYAQTPPG